MKMVMLMDQSSLMAILAEEYGGSYDNSYQQPSGDFSEISDDNAGELPF